MSRHAWPIIALDLCVLIATIGAGACTRSPARAGARAAGAPLDSAATVAELTRTAQALVDAVAFGDTAVWARTLADDGLFTDENGRTSTKRDLLASLHPLPAGFSGHIVVARPQMRMTGNENDGVAVLTYDLLEDETVFGQTLHTTYHQTDTYVRRAGRWRLLASQTQVLPSEHTAVHIDPAVLGAYVGTYRLAPNVEYAVTRDGTHLMGRRRSGPMEELFPLGGDRFFRRGAPRGVKIFVRDASGRVTRMIDRRDNNDLVWQRVR